MEEFPAISHLLFGQINEEDSSRNPVIRLRFWTQWVLSIASFLHSFMLGKAEIQINDLWCHKICFALGRSCSWQGPLVIKWKWTYSAGNPNRTGVILRLQAFSLKKFEYYVASIFKCHSAEVFSAFRVDITEAVWRLMQKLLVAFKTCKMKIRATWKACVTVNSRMVRILYWIF